MTKVKYRIPLSRPWITREDRAAVIRVLNSGRLSFGPEAGALEEEFAEKHGYKHAVAVSSGGAGIYILSVMNLAKKLPIGIFEGTFPGAIQAVRAAGMVTTFPTYSPLSPKRFISTALYSSATVFPAVGKPLFADWCEAVGTAPPSGCDAVYSFYSNKQIAGGEGGIICTNSKKDDLWLRAARNNGRTGTEWTPKFFGMNFRMTEVSAALIRSQLKRLDIILELRRKAYDEYSRRIPMMVAGTSIFAAIAKRIDPERDVRRLALNGIESRMPFPKSVSGVMVPFHTKITLKEIEEVCRCLK